MPLIIGVENGTEKGITSDEIKLTNSYGLGILCMNAGLDRIEDVSAFWYRITLTNMITGIFDDDKFRNTFNLDLVQRMKDAGWYSNVGRDTEKVWIKNMKTRLWEDAERKMEEE